MLSAVGGTVHEYGSPKYNALIPAETRKPGSRAAIVVDVYQVSTVRPPLPPGSSREIANCTYVHCLLIPALLRGDYIRRPAVMQSLCTTS